MSDERLSDLVSERLSLNWEAFREAHPGLAGAMERVGLVEQIVDDLKTDAGYREAMAQAELDERTLAAAAEVLKHVDVVVSRALGL